MEPQFMAAEMQVILIILFLFKSNGSFTLGLPIIYLQSHFTMNRIEAILTIDTDNLPANFQEIIKHEQEVVAQWKAEGILEHLFLREAKNGAVLIFKDIDLTRAKELMEQLPLYQLKKSVEYLSLMKQF